MSEERIKCPICAELIKRGAKKCRFCGEWLAEEKEPVTEDSVRGAVEPESSVQEEEDKVEETAEEPDEEKPVTEAATESPKAELVKKHTQTSWFRIILFILYIGITIALVISERNAYEHLCSAQVSERGEKYKEGLDTYREITERYPLSFAVIEALEGIHRMEKVEGLEPTADESDTCDMYWLPFVVWPACSVLLFLVLLTRLRRPGTAFLAFLFMVAAVAGSLAQLSWYGLVPSETIAQLAGEFMKEPVPVYISSYVLLVVTALLTLSGTRKDKIAQAAN
ncbi:MAG: zinc ribbon domain-containing protein [Planctomycetota bacterium]|jgi:hypothetical protein